MKEFVYYNVYVSIDQIDHRILSYGFVCNIVHTSSALLPFEKPCNISVLS